MQIKLSAPYILAFLLLTVVLLEFHEMAHIITGRIICGCWGARDFNVWGLCADCNKSHSLFWVATLAGPVFSFSLMWLGRHWLSSRNSKLVSLGFSFIFANIPFGRISEVVKGAGDEMSVTRQLLKGHLGSTQMIFTCLLFVLPLGVFPIIKAFQILQNRKRWLYILGFLTLPIAFILIYILVTLNSLLNQGFLSQPGIMGTPVLITVHTLIALFGLIILRKQLLNLNTASLEAAT